jgi:hypothetical protein
MLVLVLTCAVGADLSGGTATAETFVAFCNDPRNIKARAAELQRDLELAREKPEQVTLRKEDGSESRVAREFLDKAGQSLLSELE